MRRSTSRFLVERATVIAACENAIKAVKAKRDSLFEDEVKDQMRPRFWRRTPSRQEAEELACASYEGALTVAPWKYAWWGELEQAERLLAAATVSCQSATPELDAEDAAFIGNWAKKD